MPVPKQHLTSSRVKRRRSHLALKRVNLIPCPKCNSAKMPHRYCSNCGHYKGREVVDVLAALTKKEKKKKEKEISEKENK